jgi:hypothetical protein
VLRLPALAKNNNDSTVTMLLDGNGVMRSAVSRIGDGRKVTKPAVETSFASRLLIFKLRRWPSNVSKHSVLSNCA